MKKLFERKEMKYRLTKAQAVLLQDVLSAWLVPDAYPEYDIRSVYFDNDNWDLFRKSANKPFFKEKLRLRSYGCAVNGSDPVFLEIKKKFNGVVYKRRVDLLLKEAMAFMDQEGVHSITGMEIQWLMKHDHLRPKLSVAYHRKAWTWVDDPDLRITIDDQFSWRHSHLSLDADERDEKLFDDDTCILEIKSSKNFPILLIRTLKELDIQKTSISKAGRAYQLFRERDLIHYGIA
ncbi:MAG: polyphosphate polymerase domain-containing protein [Ileibacterium sp.]|nr:polyphosphate polymerase domain-containing protein [Ileibacterium sp.]